MDSLMIEMEKILIYVKNFSKVPGSREMDEGKKANSGEQFRKEYLEPAFKQALDQDGHVVVNLDGTLGYGTSWLEEVFGGLTRIYGRDEVMARLTIISDEEPYLIDDINDYIADAEKV